MDFFKKNLDEVSKIKEDAPQQIGFLWNLLRALVVIFVLLLISYFGLRFGYTAFLEGQIDKREAEINELATRIPESEQENFLTFYFQLVDLQDLLRNHVVASRVFPFLEANTNTQVTFENFSLNVFERTITLDGVAASYEVLAQQLEAFNQASEVERYTLSRAENIKDDLVRFNVVIFLMPQMFKV